MNILCLLGPQGSGKGTQARLLLREHRTWVSVEAGAILRKRGTRSDSLGKLIKKTLESGALLPTAISTKIILDTLDEIPAPEKATVLLDGFPRSILQARALLAWATGHHARVGIIHLTLSDREAQKRLQRRLMCTGCGDSFPISSPRQIDYCRRCGGHTETRTDDTPKAIAKRLALYHARTEPILNLFRKKKLLIGTIAAHGSITDVAGRTEKRVMHLLKRMNAKKR